MSKSAKKILATAEQLFYQHSIHAVGVDLIRDQSGCSKTTMYTYFKNKHQLIHEVLKQRDQYFRQSLEQYVGMSKGVDAISAIWDWHIQWFQQDTFKGCLFVRVVAELDDAKSLQLSQQHKQWLYTLIELHCVQFNDTQLATDLIYTLIEGIISRFLVEGYSIERANNLKKALNKILFGLA